MNTFKNITFVGLIMSHLSCLVANPYTLDRDDAANPTALRQFVARSAAALPSHTPALLEVVDGETSFCLSPKADQADFQSIAGTSRIATSSGYVDAARRLADLLAGTFALERAEAADEAPAYRLRGRTLSGQDFTLLLEIAAASA